LDSRYLKDEEKRDVSQTSNKQWALRLLLHLLHMGPVARYLSFLLYFSENTTLKNVILKQ